MNQEIKKLVYTDPTVNSVISMYELAEVSYIATLEFLVITLAKEKHELQRRLQDTIYSSLERK